MSTVVAPMSVALEPMPFLLKDQFELVGDLVIVPDEKWDSLVEMLGTEDNSIIETERGPFMIVTVIPPELREAKNEEA